MRSQRRPSKTLLRRIRLLIFDFDGVLTDNHVYVNEHGERMKRFWVPDGVGIFLAHQAGIKMAIITGSSDRATRHRAKFLRIDDFHSGVYDKLPVYEMLKRKHRATDRECLFIGDDLPDQDIFRQDCLTLAPPDAHPRILRLAKWVGTMPGGRGIVREAIDAVLAAQDGKPPKRAARKRK